MRRSSKKPRDAAEMRLAMALAPEVRTITRAGWIGVGAGLLWMVMAACVATIFGRLVAGSASPGLIWGMSAAFVAAGALRIALGARAAAILDGASDRILARERAALLSAQDRLSPRSGRSTSASIAALMTDKLPMLGPYILRYHPAALRVMVLPLAFLAVSGVLSWAVALILAVAGPLILVFMALVGMAAREASERQMDEIGSLSALLGERLAALTDIRLLDAGARMERDFATRAEALRARTMAVLRVAFLSSTVLELFAALGVAMVAVYAGFALLGEIGFGAWATPLTLPEAVFLLMLAPEFFQPLRDLAAAWHDKAAALAVARDLLAQEDGEMDASEILGTGGPSAIAPRAPTITLSGVAKGAVQAPDLTIEAGEAIALIGPSGSGKSTLIALIGGLERPDHGEIWLDGAALDTATADAWRAQIAWVPQSAQFLDGSLREELLLGAAGHPTQQDIEAALQLANATEVVARLPRGLDTVLGEMGGGVSGGEARRLMLARAALSGRAIVLADEPTADLDPETAAEIIAALLTLRTRGATVIVATHDTALAAAMDRRVTLGKTRLEDAA